MTLKDETLVTEDRPRHPVATYLRLLWADKFATAAAVFLLLVVLCAILGPALFGKASLAMNLRGRNLAPFHLEHGWLMVLGADSLGRPILARIIVAAQNTMTIAFLAVLCAAFGVTHRVCIELAELPEALAPAPGVRLVEVRAERAGLRAGHAALRAAVAAAVGCL